MATVSPSLFRWQDVESSPDILRAQRILDHLGDEELVSTLEDERGKGRDDYPVRAVWNSLVCALVFRHEGPASLIAELKRNGELRELCGFDPLLGADAVPSPWAYSRFMANVADHGKLLRKVFVSLVAHLGQLLPDLGTHLAFDGKALPVAGDHDSDADKGIKSATDGTKTITMTWFGYKLHLVCDAVHELPLTFTVTKASEHESPHLMPLVEKLSTENPQVYGRAKDLAADKGLDDGQDKAALYDDHGIVPLIPSRDLARGETAPLDPDRHDTIRVSPCGEVLCAIDPMNSNPAARHCQMQFQGFEKDRGTLKYRCPAAALGVECKNQAACQGTTKDTGFGRVVRVPLERDRRLHTPIPQGTLGFDTAYRRRTSIERIFSRLDNLYGMERHRTRGLAKMTARVTLALSAMLATAIAWIEEGRAEHRRRMLPSAAA